MFSRVRGKSPQLNCSKKADNMQKRSRRTPQLNCRKLRNVTAFFCSQLRYSSRSLLQVVGIFCSSIVDFFCWCLRDLSAEVAETPQITCRIIATMFSRVRGESPQLNCSKNADNQQKRSRRKPQLNCRNPHANCRKLQHIYIYIYLYLCIYVYIDIYIYI